MHKNAESTHQPLPDTAVVGSILRGIVTKLRNAVMIEIPIGYQDEMGFHLGVEPEEKEIKWLSV
jgi:hypothetical protein